MSKLHRFLALALGLAVGGSAAANVVYTLDGSLNGTSVGAQADFAIDTTTDTITLSLTNTTGSISKIIQMLTGFTFTLSGNATITNVTGVADGSVDCVGATSGGPCTVDGTDVDVFGTPPDLDGNTHNAAPTGWKSLDGYALFTFGAGGGSFKPWGIVNDSVVGSGNDGNTGNPQHNPMLLGPVVFTFTFDDLVDGSTITAAQFYFGTGGDHRAGTCTDGCPFSLLDPRIAVPEPQTLPLLALALLGMGLALRRRAPHRA